jgi:hypothetical protein
VLEVLVVVGVLEALIVQVPVLKALLQAATCAAALQCIHGKA